ncbi:MAG: alpha-hydroxy acid oxidase [Cyanobacteria bacterium P01_C01_bin.118]
MQQVSETMPNKLASVRNPERLKHFPMIEDVRRRAIARLPDAIRGFLECGSGYETCLTRNRDAFDDVTFAPRYIGSNPTPCLTTRLFGHDYAVPFGMAPVGMADIVWPGTETILRQTSARRHLPYVVGMLGSATVEDAAKDTAGPRWLHLYPLHDRNILDDIVDRAADYDVLVLTIDCPTLGRRESMRRAGFSLPSPQFKDPRFIASCCLHPHWILRRRQLGIRFYSIFEPYVNEPTQPALQAFIRRQMPVAISWKDLRHLRDRWPRHLVVKGVTNADEAKELEALGVDALWVSNHGGRQLDALPSSLDILKSVRTAVSPKLPVFIDSGVRSGLDVIRAMALGADFVFLGRPFLYGTIAFDEEGGDVIVDILTDELLNTLQLLGIESISSLQQSVSSSNSLVNLP